MSAVAHTGRGRALVDRRWGLVPLAALLIAARGYETHPFARVLLPSSDEPGRELVVAPGEVVTRSAAMQAPSARLDVPVTVNIASVDQTLPAGTELLFVGVAGDAAERLPRLPEAFCAIRRITAGVAARIVLDVAAFGLLRGLNRASPVSTHCFVDTDDDGRFDTVFLSGARRETDLEPRPVGPLAATIERNRPIEGVSEARIVFAGPTGRRGRRIAFRFETASPAGAAVQQQVGATINVSDLPRTVKIQGAEIEVLSYDAATRSTRLRLVRPMAAGGYDFTPPRQVTYIPVFIPR